MNIFVGSLPFRLEESELKEHFEKFGAVNSAKIIIDKYSGRSKGFGFVEMPDDEEAKKAIEALHNSDMGGRTVVVNQAEERKEGSGGGGGRRNFGGGGNRGGGGGGYNRDRNSGGNRY